MNSGISCSLAQQPIAQPKRASPGSNRTQINRWGGTKRLYFKALDLEFEFGKCFAPTINYRFFDPYFLIGRQ
jgi:hypothetical protein